VVLSKVGFRLDAGTERCQGLTNLCGNRGFVANSDALCTSDLGPLSSYSYSQCCSVYLPSQDLLTVTSYQGTILSYPLVIVSPVTTGLSTSTSPIEPTDTPGLVVVSAVPVVALVYRQKDVTGGGHGSTAVPEVDSASSMLKPNLFSLVLGTALAAWAVANSF
jgi:hypothetical protein